MNSRLSSAKQSKALSNCIQSVFEQNDPCNPGSLFSPGRGLTYCCAASLPALLRTATRECSWSAGTTATQTLMGLTGLVWTCGIMLRKRDLWTKPLQNLRVATTRSSVGRWTTTRSLTLCLTARERSAPGTAPSCARGSFSIVSKWSLTCQGPLALT